MLVEPNKFVEVECKDPNEKPSNPFEASGESDFLGLNADYVKIQGNKPGLISICDFEISGNVLDLNFD